jgi:hypothetical protein
MIVCRKRRGNVIFLVSLLVGLIFLVVMCGMGFNQVLFLRGRAEYAADAQALSFASKMNFADRIGEVNELQQASRELIFNSRQDCFKCADGVLPDLNNLCYQLVDEARSGQSLLESERKNQVQLICAEAQNAILAYNRTSKQENEFAFMGLRIFQPEIARVEIGRINNVDSNVRSLGGMPGLDEFDLQKRYFDKKTKLYRGEIDAKLPEPDADLDFNFSSLPAYVGNTETAARNTNPSVFTSYGTIYSDGKIRAPLVKRIPSAIQIQSGMNVIMPWDQSKTIPITTVATGCTNGASLDSK